MKNLIPKSYNKNKKYLFLKVTWLDLLLILLFLFLSVGISLSFLFLKDLSFRLICSIPIFATFMFLMIFLKDKNYRVYQHIFYMIRFTSNPKSYSKQNPIRNSEKLVSFNSIENNIVSLSNKNIEREFNKIEYKKILKVYGLNISIFNNNQRDLHANEFKFVLSKLSKSKLSIYKADDLCEYDNQVNDINELMSLNFQNYHNEQITEEAYYNKAKLLENYKNEILELKKQNKKNGCLYFVISADEKNDLINETNIISQALKQMSYDVVELDKIEIMNFYKNLFNPYSNNFKDDFNTKNTDLKSLLSFNKIDFQRDHFTINKKLYASFLVINELPNVVDDYWLNDIIFSNNANFAIHFSETTYLDAKKSVYKTLSHLAIRNKNSKSLLEGDNFNDFKILAENFIQKKESFLNTNIIIYVYSDSYESLMKKVDKIELNLLNKNISINRLKYQQIEGYLAYINGTYQKWLSKHSSEVPLLTISKGFALNITNLSNNGAFLLGSDPYGNDLFFKAKNSSESIRNNNIFVLGTNGAGKTTFIKKIINFSLLENSKTFVFDFENQYDNLASYYNAKNIDLNNETGSVFNPLQVFNLETTKLSSRTLIKNHLSFLTIFFRNILKSLSDQENDLLIKIISDLYESFGIYEKNITELKPNQFPIFDDLIDFLNKNWNSYLEKYNKLVEFMNIKNAIENNFIANGRYSDIYNKHTNISLDNEFILFKLFNQNNYDSDRIFWQLNYALILVLNDLINNINKKGITIILENIDFFLNQKSSILFDYISNLFNLIKKNNGRIIISGTDIELLQNKSDNSNKIMSLFFNSQFLFLFNQNPNNLKQLSNWYSHNGFQLSEIEEDFLLNAKVGECLFIASSKKRYELKININEYEKDIFNYGGEN